MADQRDILAQVANRLADRLQSPASLEEVLGLSGEERATMSRADLGRTYVAMVEIADRLRKYGAGAHGGTSIQSRRRKEGAGREGA